MFSVNTSKGENIVPETRQGGDLPKGVDGSAVVADAQNLGSACVPVSQIPLYPSEYLYPGPQLLHL